jgi:hypothetical protein
MDKARGPDEARSYRKERGSELVAWVPDACAALGGPPCWWSWLLG